MLYVKNVCKYLFIFTPYFLKWCLKRHVVEYDKLRFQPEIICNAVCEECLQISIYIYPLFSQLVKNDMLLSMINSDFSQKSFVMLYVKNVSKYLFIFTPYFLKWCHANVVEYDKLRFQPDIICNCMWRMFANIYLYLPLISQLLKNGMVSQNMLLRMMSISAMLLSMINSDFSQKSFVMYVKNVCKYLFIFTPYFLKWCQTTCC